MNHLPCPFCGQPGSIRGTYLGSWIACSECDSHGESAYINDTRPGETKEDAAWRLWDQRVENPLVSKLRELHANILIASGKTWDARINAPALTIAAEIARLLAEIQPTDAPEFQKEI